MSDLLNFSGETIGLASFKKVREKIISRWKSHGLLGDLKEDFNENIVQLFESCGCVNIETGECCDDNCRIHKLELYKNPAAIISNCCKLARIVSGMGEDDVIFTQIRKDP
jgi:hypothetical protein